LWGAEQPDHFEDISETIDIKIASLIEHHTQLDNAKGWQDRVRQRAVELGANHGYAAAEGFKKMIV
jgi:LmbE family N-acetylglucosaminyl deacetylase